MLDPNTFSAELQTLLANYAGKLLQSDGLTHVRSKSEDRTTAELDIKGAYRNILVRERDGRSLSH